MNRTESSEYERLVDLLMSELCCASPGISVRGGDKNLIRGASGHNHQIDVSIHSPTELVLIECKHVGKNLEPHHVLTHSARLMDIRAAHPKISVNASVVSIKSASIGAKRIADHFGIQMDLALSLEEYCVTLKERHHVGTISRANASDSADAEVRRRG